MSLRWRRHPNERGLAFVGQRERGLELRDKGVVIANVYPHVDQYRRTTGWWWVARIGDDLMNTCAQRWDTKEEAKAAADAWVRERYRRGAR